MRRAKPLLIPVAVLLLMAPVAHAAVFSGRTSQDRKVVLQTNARDLPSAIGIRWHAPCADGGRLVQTTNIETPFDERTRTFLRDRGAYRTTVEDRQGREYNLRIRRAIRGRLVDEDTWRGRFRARAVVRRNGERVTTCRKRGIRWRATR
jgi:hypothetical protein